MSAATNQSLKIVPTVIPAHLRGATLPRKFPGLFLIYEFLVYRYLEEFSHQYSGGYWEFVELSNGGFYMSLKCLSRYHLCVATNGFEGDMSADAASVVVNLFALANWQMSMSQTA